LENRNKIIGVGLIVVGILGVTYFDFFRSFDLNQAYGIADKYLDSVNIPDIAIDEVMEFEYNYYVVYYEKSTNIGAFEMLIDKETEQIFPEYGPNMMWNLKYGHGGMMGGSGMMGPGGMMGGGYYYPNVDPISEDAALEIAQGFLDTTYPGSLAEEAHRFYGYYTIHTVKDGVVQGMLSVNEYTGSVWYHNWHGRFIQSKEYT
jgi:hypothetical protein